MRITVLFLFLAFSARAFVNVGLEFDLNKSINNSFDYKSSMNLDGVNYNNYKNNPKVKIGFDYNNFYFNALLSPQNREKFNSLNKIGDTEYKSYNIANNHNVYGLEALYKVDLINNAGFFLGGGITFNSIKNYSDYNNYIFEQGENGFLFENIENINISYKDSYTSYSFKTGFNYMIVDFVSFEIFYIKDFANYTYSNKIKEISYKSIISDNNRFAFSLIFSY